MKSEINDLVFKVIVVGESGSGKSCLIQRYLNDQFLDNYAVTLGVEYHSKMVKIDGNLQVRLKIWDTAGQEAFNSIVKSFYRNAHVVILVYDISRRDTFERLDNWHMQALENSPQDTLYVLVGTHLDLCDRRQVGEEEAHRWMEEATIEIGFQTSAKTAQNINKMFEQVCSQLLLHELKKSKGEGTKGQSLQLRPQEDSSALCC